jgi:hypothetical protein
MSVKLNRPPKPDESQKNSNFNGKTIPYPGFEPGFSGLAVGSHNHCTIGSVYQFFLPSTSLPVMLFSSSTVIAFRKTISTTLNDTLDITYYNDKIEALEV